MAWEKAFIFDPADLVHLLVHYTGGEIPLGAEVTNVGFNPYLTRFIGLELESDEWDSTDPLRISYDGSRTMSWTKGQENSPWAKREDTPRRQ